MRVCIFEQDVKPLCNNKKPEHVRLETLQMYQQTARLAKEKGCCLLVFPELGVYTGISPEQRLPIAEPLPEIGDAPSEHSQTALSVLARSAAENSIYIVASVVERADVYYNTTIVFDPHGKLAGRHRKVHLYLEPGISPSREPPRCLELAGLGRVELITCFDVFFGEANRRRRKPPIDFACLVTHWYDETPHLPLLSTARAWAMYNKIPVIVSNMRHLQQGTLGAGLFYPNGSGEYSMSFSKDQDLLHVFDMVCPNKPGIIRSPQDVTTVDFGLYQPIATDLSRFDRIPLVKRSETLRIDLATVSCQLTYELMQDPTLGSCGGVEPLVTLVMLAADGTRLFGNGDRLYLQELYVVAFERRSHQPAMRSGPPFRSLRLNMVLKDDLPPSVEDQTASSGRDHHTVCFGNRAVFPIVLGDNLSLIDPSRWNFSAEKVELKLTGRIACAGICRRVFNKDIPAFRRRRSQTL